MAVLERVDSPRQPARRRRAPSRTWSAIRYHGLSAIAGLALLYLFAPIAVIVAFSFNNPPGKFNFTWHGFTTQYWRHPFGAPGIEAALRLSLEIALLSTLVATALGTLIALALARYKFKLRDVTNFAIFLPMATAEVVMGSSLLTLFIAADVARGFMTILIAHIMFNISYVVVTVKARMHGFDRGLEEAAMDLYANAFQTFRQVTLPLIFPGIVAAALLAFALSIDDFVITQFNAGSSVTFPVFIYGAARVGVPVQVNVIGSAIFLLAIGGMGINLIIQASRGRRDARITAGRGHTG